MVARFPSQRYHRTAARPGFHRQADLDTEIACFGHGKPLTTNAAAALRTATEQLPRPEP
jgi:hypothetical protein